MWWVIPCKIIRWKTYQHESQTNSVFLHSNLPCSQYTPQILFYDFPDRHPTMDYIPILYSRISSVLPCLCPDFHPLLRTQKVEHHVGSKGCSVLCVSLGLDYPAVFLKKKLPNGISQSRERCFYIETKSEPAPLSEIKQSDSMSSIEEEMKENIF